MLDKITYSQALIDLAEAVEWIRSLGIKTSGTRFARYASMLAKTDRMDIKRYFALHYESSLLVEIHKHFPSGQVNVLKKLLPEIVKGPLVQSEELQNSSGSKARNIQYELVLGCRLARLGLEPKFGEEKEDLSFRFKESTVFVECKRPWSVNGIEGAIKESIRQLRTRFHDDIPNEKGIIGLSIDRIANPSSAAPLFLNPEETFDSMFQHTNELLEPYVRMLRERIEPKLAGIICSFATPSESENSKGDLYIMKMDTFAPLDYVDTVNHKFMAELNEYVNKKEESTAQS